MRAPSFPPCLIERRGAWRWGVVALAGAAAASTAVWLAALFGATAAASATSAAAAALAAAASAVRATRLAPLELGFDGLQWSLDGGGAVGRVDVVVDLGWWMLLRHVPQDARGRVQWLPVSRARLGARWHALRCAACAGAPQAAGGSQAA